MVSTKLMYFLLPVFLFVEICDSQECADANTAVLADFDLTKFSPTDIYQCVGMMVLNSTNPDVTGSSGVSINNFDQCYYMKYKIETDVNENTWTMVQQGFDGNTLQIKFENLPQGYGDFVINGTNPNSVLHAKFLTQSVEPWQIISICSQVKDRNGVVRLNISFVRFFLNTKTPNEANTFTDKVDEVIRENKFQVTGATNFCPTV